MPVPSGDGTVGEAGPDQLHAVAFLSGAPSPVQLLRDPCAWPLPSPAAHRPGHGAVSDASPGVGMGAQRSQPGCQNFTAGGAAGTGRTAKGEGY